VARNVADVMWEMLADAVVSWQNRLEQHAAVRGGRKSG